jgi:hypothetical protein
MDRRSFIQLATGSLAAIATGAVAASEVSTTTTGPTPPGLPTTTTTTTTTTGNTTTTAMGYWVKCDYPECYWHWAPRLPDDRHEFEDCLGETHELHL